MTACILHGTLPAAQPWFCDLGVMVYDFQTLIAGALAISEFTVRKHRASILRKLNLRTTAQLTAHATASAGTEQPSSPFPHWLTNCGHARSRSFAWSAMD